MKARLERIGLLARANKGFKMLPSVIEGLSQALSSSVSSSCFTSLEETDRLMQAFQDGYGTCSEVGTLCYRRRFGLASEKHVFAMTTCFAGVVEEESVWLLLPRVAKYCGAVSLSASDLFSRARSVLSFDKDALCVISRDTQQGFLLDYNPHDLDDTFEVAVWGERWPLLLLNCGPNQLQNA